MNKTAKSSLILAIFLSGLCRISSAEDVIENWELKKDEDNIKSYIRQITESKYVETRHITVIDAPISAVLSALIGGEGCKPWLSVCVSAKIVEQLSEEEYLGYAIIDMPWPLSHRDLVYRSKKTVDPGTGTVIIEQNAEPESYPESEWVRMVSRNKYQLEPLSDDSVRLIWTVHSNPGGNVPSSLVNSKIHKTTRKDLISLLEYVSDR